MEFQLQVYLLQRFEYASFAFSYSAFRFAGVKLSFPLWRCVSQTKLMPILAYI